MPKKLYNKVLPSAIAYAKKQADDDAMAYFIRQLHRFAYSDNVTNMNSKELNVYFNNHKTVILNNEQRGIYYDT